MNDFRTCKWCGNIYVYVGNPFCGECLKKMDNEFAKVKEFLYRSPNATIQEVVDETEVDERSVLYFLKDGRLEMSAATGLLKCEQCGSSIKTGRLCSRCATSLSTVLESAVQKGKSLERERVQKKAEQTASKSEKMHIDRN